MFEIKATLKYDPYHPDAIRKGQRSWWMKADLPDSIRLYYADWIRKETGLHLNRPMWGNHVTVIRGEQVKNVKAWKKYDGDAVLLRYSENIQMSDKYAWLPVESLDLEDIRVELGLYPQPRCPFHATIGNFKTTTPPIKKKVAFVTFPWESNNYLDFEPNEYTIKP